MSATGGWGPAASAEGQGLRANRDAGEPRSAEHGSGDGPASAPGLASRLLKATVHHERTAVCEHGFRRRVAYLELCLDELPEAFGRNLLASAAGPSLLWLRRADFLRPKEVSLDEAVRARVAETLGRRPAGRIRLVTQPRTLGYQFNPVSFYLCEDAAGELDVFVAEITNTPWGERHAYVLEASSAEPVGREGLRWRFGKDFHVSPFFDMEQVYEWTVSRSEKQLAIHMTNLEGGREVFRAGFEAERQPLHARGLALAALRHPLQPLRTHLAIYTHAARLLLKRAPFFTHPSKRVPSAT